MPSSKSTSIGIVGCGAIGRALLEAADSGMMNVTVAGVTSRTEDTARSFLSTLAAPPPYLGRDELIACPDLVVETAGGHVFPDLALEVFDAGKDLMVISTGALVEHPEIIQNSGAAAAAFWPPLAPSPALTVSNRPAPGGWTG